MILTYQITHGGKICWFNESDIFMCDASPLPSLLSLRKAFFWQMHSWGLPYAEDQPWSPAVLQRPKINKKYKKTDKLFLLLDYLQEALTQVNINVFV